MSDQPASFIGSIPENYDRGLGPVFFTDFADDMGRRGGDARGKFAPGGTGEFQPADPADLPFPDQSFDAVVCQFGVMFFPDKEKSYREATRVLKPGGRYLFSVCDEHRFNPAPRLVHEMLGALFPDVPPRFYEVPFAYHSIDPIREAVTEAGFSDFRAAVLHIDKTVPDIASFARGLIYGNPVVEQIR